MAVPVAIFDPQIREVDLLIEVRQVALACPLADLLIATIRVAIVVGAVPIALVQPALVLTLELVVENDAFDTRVTLGQPLRGVFVCAINLEVVFPLSLAFEAVPERLAVTLVAASMMFEEVPAFLCQRDGMLARAGHANRFHQPLLAEISQVTRTRIERPIMTGSKVTTGDHSKGTHRGQSARF